MVASEIELEDDEDANEEEKKERILFTRIFCELNFKFLPFALFLRFIIGSLFCSDGTKAIL